MTRRRGTLRAVAFVVLAAAVVTWTAVAPHLDTIGLWPTVAIISVAVLPATLGLIYLALPVWASRWVIVAGIVFGVTAAVSWEAGSHLVSNFAKLGVYTCAGWIFLRLFEELAWVVIVAAIIPFVDAFSVAAGPTKDIVHHHIEVYSAVAVSFVGPGGPSSALGPPDVLFFALFLAATARWGLRPFWTWLAMSGMYALTLVLAVATDASGLPALPFLSAGFLLANADLIWQRLRPRR